LSLKVQILKRYRDKITVNTMSTPELSEELSLHAPSSNALQVMESMEKLWLLVIKAELGIQDKDAMDLSIQRELSILLSQLPYENLC
jgi:hypothetical protein